MPGSGDADLAAVATLFADPTRARILGALADGRSLAASVLADEAGVSAQAASAQLARLRTAGLIVVEQSGRHRYHRISHTRAAAVRRARSCYDHLAGRAGVDLTQALLDRGALESTDGVADTRRRADDPISATLPRHPYRLGPQAGPVLTDLGVDLDAVLQQRSRRPVLRFCLDWSEQRHHLGGLLGATVLTTLLDRGVLVRARAGRALLVTDDGAAVLAGFGRSRHRA
jgi:DNA-binding transcriptional ArsR family regulator